MKQLYLKRTSFYKSHKLLMAVWWYLLCLLTQMIGYFMFTIERNPSCYVWSYLSCTIPCCTFQRLSTLNLDKDSFMWQEVNGLYMVHSLRDGFATVINCATHHIPVHKFSRISFLKLTKADSFAFIRKHFSLILLTSICTLARSSLNRYAYSGVNTPSH